MPLHPLALALWAALTVARARPPDPPAPPPAASLPAPDADDAVRLLSAAVRGEPSTEEIQRAAAARATLPRAVSESWRRRARLAPLIPRVSAEYRHDERSYRVVGVTSTSEVDYLRQQPGDTVGVRVAWNLDGLVFGRAELDAVAAAQRADDRRAAAVRRATELQFERLRRRLELVAAAPTGLARARLELDLEELTAELRALTGLALEGSP
ncbi:MAG: hypothetical protein ACJ79R_20015 [Anaeromyxobacteraceae bacterium]